MYMGRPLHVVTWGYKPTMEPNPASRPNSLLLRCGQDLKPANLFFEAAAAEEDRAEAAGAARLRLGDFDTAVRAPEPLVEFTGERGGAWWVVAVGGDHDSNGGA